MSELTCRLIASIPEGTPLNRVLAKHKEHCLRCQADDARSSGVSRELAGLSGQTLSAPEGLATNVLSRLPAQDGSDPRRPLVVRVAVRWSATALVILATAIAVVAGILSRSKRSRS